MKELALYIMSFLYIVAGMYHFLNPKLYIRIIPRWIPYPALINYVSGALEMVLAVLLLFDSTRIPAAWALILLLIIIFPANIQMSLNFYERQHKYFWLTVVRLPLQLVFIWWAWLYTQPLIH